jgi:alpha-ketoglutarate-dependent taurine dioxygenase
VQNEGVVEAAIMQIIRFNNLGAEILGVDVKTLSDGDFAKIYRTWLDCNVICVRDQVLTIEAYLAYSRRFGVISPHPSKSTRHPECPEVTLLGINKFNTDGTLNKPCLIKPRSCMRWRFPAGAVTRSFPVLTRRMTRCRSG